MKKLVLVVGLAGIVAVPKVFADLEITLTQNTGQYSDSVGGGEFRAVGNAALNNAVDWSAYNTGTTANTAGVGDAYFQTFCTETAEEFTPGVQYTISSIGNAALYDGTGSPVLITKGVAYLYSQFAAGTLEGYDYTYGSGRAADALILQRAIWYLLGEDQGSNPYGAALAGFALTDLNNSLIPKSDWTAPAKGAYGVADMVLGTPGQAQDQLVMVVPEPTTLIAGAMLLLPLGASTLRFARRNRKA